MVEEEDTRDCSKLNNVDATLSNIGLFIADMVVVVMDDVGVLSFFAVVCGENALFIGM